VRDSFRKAILNISKFGDTDIFPLNFERHVFADRPEEVITLLEQFHRDFDQKINHTPPGFVKTLVPVGYTGFRWATQIEPFWNAYYLALVIEVAQGIEAERIPVAQRRVFSYRYQYDQQTGKLFSEENWRDYRIRARELAVAHEYVAITDISDFYPRIYHHRIDNALRRVPGGEAVRPHLLKILSVFSGRDSYGLPVGGPASRVLAELALNDVDHHLESKGIDFCRYADDYTIGAHSKDDAYRALVLLATKLSYEGLTLQKQKTRVITKQEYLDSIAYFDPLDNPDPAQSAEDRLLSISIRFDPYSPHAAEDYERLRTALHDIDIVGILGREVAKASIDQVVAKQAISAVASLEPEQRDGAIRTLLDVETVNVLAPVFMSVMRLVRAVYDDLSDASKEYVSDFLEQLHRSSAHVLSVDVNLAYFVQAIARTRSTRKNQVMVDIFDRSHNQMVRRQVVMGMIESEGTFWLREQKGNFANVGEMEKRAILLGSFWLRDEGSHWRAAVARGLTPEQTLIKEWFSGRWQAGNRSAL